MPADKGLGVPRASRGSAARPSARAAALATWAFLLVLVTGTCRLAETKLQDSRGATARVNRLVLEDALGRARVEIGVDDANSPYIRLNDDSERPRIRVRLIANQFGSVEMLRQDGGIITNWVNVSDGGSALSLKASTDASEKLKRGIELSVGYDSPGTLSLADTSGTTRLALVIRSSGPGMLTFDPDGKLAAQMPELTDGEVP